MIVRILGEGQYHLADRELSRLNELDGRLTRALEAGDRPGFETDFAELVAYVRRHGVARGPDYLGGSDIVLPAADSDFDDVRVVMGVDGLVPG
ncbi:MAG: hypothetical protein HY264_01620 [Chloroflexi bacterium]|nr:hypothetical protein [Chloroflexota bacterium]